MSAGSTRIIIEGVSRTFAQSRGKPTAAVSDVSLTIEPGEMFFLLGPSGCGKTTLLRMIAGFLEPTAGRILFESGAERRDVTHEPAQNRNTAMVFQSYALWPHMSVGENVCFGLDVRKVAAAEKRDRAMRALDQVQLGAYYERKPNQLSGGQQQRVALARALVVRPSVLLLDEPLSNLDARLRVELRSEIRRVCKSAGITTVYVTHDQSEAMSMADRVAILQQGRVVQVGEPRQLYRRPQSRFVAEFLGETNILEAKVEAASPTAASFRSAIGLLDGVPCSQGVGESVLLSIRPEAVHVHPDSSGDLIEATITESTYLGNAALHHLSVGGARINAVESNRADHHSRSPGTDQH